MTDTKFSNLATAEPLCACLIERVLAQPSDVPEFVRRPFDALIREEYSALYAPDGGCVVHRKDSPE